MIFFKLFCNILVVVVKNDVIVFMKVIIIKVVGEYLNKGEYFVIIKMFVVIIVVVWIKVDIGVGYFLIIFYVFIR